MPDEFVDARKLKEGLLYLNQAIADLGKVVEEVNAVQRLTLDACIQELRVLFDMLKECSALETEFEDVAKYEESLYNLIEAAPLEETQKVELRQEAEERLKFENYWKQKEHNRAVAAIIAGIVGSILTAIISIIGNSGTTINIDSPTIVIEDAESAENLIAQMEELLDNLQEE
ncbi:MAG: hypothetical protein IKL00_03990 [Oscillospiraceae bacterium]|nr:hypothetical protein [Oscillospiraceae bacterium]